MDGDGQKVAIEEFLASRPCCLDEGFSTPLVRKLRLSDDPAKELATAPMQALLQQLRRRLVKATNMELESMLAQAKASVPFGKQAPLSERLVYLSLLNQLMKAHLEQGRVDSRGPESRSSLLERGVPLRQHPPTTSRVDERWIRIMINRWKALHPGASGDDFVEKRQALRAQWASMSDEERNREVQALPARWNQELGEDPVVASPEPHVGFGASETFFDMGCREWPVRTDVLSSFLRQEDGQASEPGVARKAVAARRKAVSQLLVCDQGDVPDERKYEIRLSCQELHPGICAWVDRDIYASALKLAHNFEVYFDNDKLHKFACISDPSHDASSRQQSWYVYFTRRRARRPHSQVTHVFVACVVHPDPGGTYVSLEQRSLGLWRFQTVWDIAKAARRSRYKQLSVQMMDSVPAGNGSFLLTCSCEDARILWPGVLKRHRPPVDGPPVDESAARVKSKGKHRTAGIKLHLPAVALEGVLGMEIDAEADLGEESGFGSDLAFEGSSEEEENWHLADGDVPYRHSKRGVDGR